MSMEISSNYMNSLTAVKADKSVVTELQSRQQQLQNELLFIKASGTDSVGVPIEKQEEMEDRLKEVSQKLRKARIDYRA